MVCAFIDDALVISKNYPVDNMKAIKKFLQELM